MGTNAHQLVGTCAHYFTISLLAPDSREPRNVHLCPQVFWPLRFFSWCKAGNPFAKMTRICRQGMPPDSVWKCNSRSTPKHLPSSARHPAACMSPRVSARRVLNTMNFRTEIVSSGHEHMYTLTQTHTHTHTHTLKERLALKLSGTNDAELMEVLAMRDAAKGLPF